MKKAVPKGAAFFILLLEWDLPASRWAHAAQSGRSEGSAGGSVGTNPVPRV
jgi:hypothetical protein